MIGPDMLLRLLRKSALSENEISQTLITPALERASQALGYALMDIRFTGGASELGNDIEFFELIGPDQHRLYTGIQVKKGDLGLGQATMLITQGSQALEKEISDISSGHSYRIGRWIVAVTGGISSPAQQEIIKNLGRYGKLISFWDGQKIARLLHEHYYNGVMEILDSENRFGDSSNFATTIFDPDQAPVLSQNFSSVEWSPVAIGDVVPFLADGIVLGFYPIAGNIPSATVGVRSSLQDAAIDSLQSQIGMLAVRLSHHEASIDFKVLNGGPVKIVCRGYQFLR